MQEMEVACGGQTSVLSKVKLEAPTCQTATIPTFQLIPVVVSRLLFFYFPKGCLQKTSEKRLKVAI